MKINNQITQNSKIVVSGVGLVTAKGTGAEVLAQSLNTDATVIPKPSQWVSDLNVDEYVKLKTKSLDIVSSMVLVATSIAIKQAKWKLENKGDDRIGYVLATTLGNMSVLQNYLSDSSPSPLRFVHSFINAPAGLACQVFKLRGAHALLCSGMSAGLQAIRYSSFLLRSNKCDKVLCGAVDSYRYLDDRVGEMVSNTRSGKGEGVSIIAMERGIEGDLKASAYRELLGRIVIGEQDDIITIRNQLNEMLGSIDSLHCNIEKIFLVAEDERSVSNSEAILMQVLNVATEKYIYLKQWIGDTGAAHAAIAFGLANYYCQIIEKKNVLYLVNSMQDGVLTVQFLKGTQS